MFKTIYEELNPLLGGAEAEGFGVGVGHEEPIPALRDRRRCATAVAAVKASQAFTPSREGIPRQASTHMQNSGSKKR